MEFSGNWFIIHFVLLTFYIDKMYSKFPYYVIWYEYWMLYELSERIQTLIHFYFMKDTFQHNVSLHKYLIWLIIIKIQYIVSVGVSFDLGEKLAISQKMGTLDW